MTNKPKQVGVDTPMQYSSKLQNLGPGDAAVFIGTTKDSEGRAAHKDPVKIVQQYKDGSVVAKNRRTGRYFKTNVKFIFKESPFSVNEQFDTLQLRPNVYVHVKGLGKRWIDQVDYTGQNVENKIGHLAVLVKRKPASKESGQWISYMDLDYEYPEMEDDVTKNDKELTNIVKEAKKMANNKFQSTKRSKNKSSGIGPTPERYFKSRDLPTQRKESPEDVSSFAMHGKHKVPPDDTFGLNKEETKDTSLGNLMPSKKQSLVDKCPQCTSDNVVPDEQIEDMCKCQDCGKSFTKGDLKEGKLTGKLKKWSDLAKKLAKEIFANKKFTELSDREVAKAFEEVDNRKKRKKIEGPYKMKNDGSIDRSDEEEED